VYNILTNTALMLEAQLGSDPTLPQLSWELYVQSLRTTQAGM